jgi:hypothetical protein
VKKYLVILSVLLSAGVSPLFADFSRYIDIVRNGGSPEQVAESLNQLSYAGYKPLFWNYVKYLEYTAGESDGGTGASLVRKAAAEALGRLNDDRAVKYLVDRYAVEKNVQVKASILYGLGFYRDAGIGPVIDDGLSSADENIRYHAMMAAVSSGKKDSAAKIRKLFAEEKDPAMKMTESFALYSLGDDQKANGKFLTDGLKDKDPVARYRSVDYISRLKLDSAADEVVRAMEIENKWWVRVEMDKTLAVLYAEKRRKRDELEASLYNVSPSGPQPPVNPSSSPSAAPAPSASSSQVK